ncbi:UNVERIFIED_CONTAM: hypothetical protein K2H54_037750 [Gekko kuhli]
MGLGGGGGWSVPGNVPVCIGRCWFSGTRAGSELDLPWDKSPPPAGWSDRATPESGLRGSSSIPALGLAGGGAAPERTGGGGRCLKGFLKKWLRASAARLSSPPTPPRLPTAAEGHAHYLRPLVPGQQRWGGAGRVQGETPPHQGRWEGSRGGAGLSPPPRSAANLKTKPGLRLMHRHRIENITNSPISTNIVFYKGHLCLNSSLSLFPL